MVKAQQLQEDHSEDNDEICRDLVSLPGEDENRKEDESCSSSPDMQPGVHTEQAIHEMSIKQTKHTKQCQGLLSFIWSMSIPDLYIALAGFVSAAFAGFVYPVLGILFGNVVFALTPSSRGDSHLTVNFWQGCCLC